MTFSEILDITEANLVDNLSQPMICFKNGKILSGKTQPACFI